MKIFIVSSTENKNTAKWIEDILIGINEDEKLNMETIGWWDDTSFPFGLSFYESLIKLTTECSAAIIVAGEEDMVSKRNEANFQPRDNVILELGLFSGKNGRERTLVACIGNTNLPSDLEGITKLNLKDVNDETAFKKSNRSKIKSWLNQIKINTREPNEFSLQFPNLYKAVSNIIEEIKSLRRSVNSQSIDILASNIFAQLTSSVDENSYIAGFLVQRIDSELKDSISVLATDVLGPSAWISPDAYRYLAIQIKYYSRKNTVDSSLKIVVNSDLGDAIKNACKKVKNLTGIGESFSLFDNPRDFHWEIGQPKLQFARILLWSKEELLSSIGDSIIAIHQAFNVPLFFLETSDQDPIRETDFILFEKTDDEESGFYNSKKNNFIPQSLIKGSIPKIGNCKVKFNELLKNENLMLAIDARHILKYDK